MTFRKELFDHPNWWKNQPLTDLNETDDEFNARLNYLIAIKPNSKAITETTIGDDEKLPYESVDEYRARIRNDYMLLDVDCNDDFRNDFYLNNENTKDTLASDSVPNNEWYINYLKKTASQ